MSTTFPPACPSPSCPSADAPAYMGNTTHDAKAMTTGTSLSPFFHTDIDDKCLDVVKADPDNRF